MSAGLKVGMRVRPHRSSYQGNTKTVDHERDYLLLAEHPTPRTWWLQDAETGHVSTTLYAHETALRLVADDYRAKTDLLELSDGTRLVVKFRAGRWAVCGTQVYYVSDHEPAKHLGEPYNLVGGAVPWKVKIGQAKRLASELDAVLPDFWAELDVPKRHDLVRSAILRAFDVAEGAA